MWFFDWFEEYFDSTRLWFWDTADAISTVPYVGSSLASPFSDAGTFFGNLSTAAGYASDWSDTVYADAFDVANDASGYLESWYPVLTASGSWFFNRIVSPAESYWSILTASNSMIFSRIRSYCTSTWSILSDTRSTLWTYIQGRITSVYAIVSYSAVQMFGYIRSQIEGTYAILSDTRASLWSWISTSTLPGWVQSWFSGQSTTVINFVTAQWGYLITSAFTFLGSNWVSFENNFAWFVDKLIALVRARMTSFASLLWGALEDMLDNIQIVR